MGPCDETLRCRDCLEADFVQQGCSFAGFDQFVQLLLIGRQLLVQVQNMLGQPYRFRSRNPLRQFFFPFPLAADFSDLATGQLLAGVDPQAIAAYQRVEGVDQPGAVLAHGGPGSDKDAQSLPDSFMQPWKA